MVVIRTTPFDPPVPYDEAPAGPLITSMLSISSGFKLARAVTPISGASPPPARQLEFSTFTPSTKNTGWPSPLSPPPDLICILNCDPAMPDALVRDTPATLPAKILSTEE